MATNEAGVEAASVSSQGSPLAEKSALPNVQDSVELASNDAGTETAKAEHAEAETAEVVAAPDDENDDDERAEGAGLSAGDSDKDMEGDKEAGEEKVCLESAEKGEPSALTATTDAEKTNAEGKAEGKKEKRDKEKKAKGGKEEKKNKIVSRRTRMRKNKRMRARAVAVLLESGGAEENAEEGSSDDSDENEEIKGFIFMCSAKTKKDCFNYKIFGLPESRKETVAKVYKGMKLFLYDFDLKLLYGIYQAAGPGGYNIEPKAFKSAFPSQVRFTVVEDCTPLSEENFRQAIRENYTRKNKFDCRLSGDQVQKLCKLFRHANRRSALKRKAEENKRESSGYPKRYRESGYGLQNQSERGWTGYPDYAYQMVPDHYGRDVYGRPALLPSYLSTSHHAAPPPPPLPGHGYGGVDYYGRVVPLEGYARNSFGYYRDPARYPDSLYYPSSSAQYYDAPPPQYRH